jgi:hypothetical protein
MTRFRLALLGAAVICAVAGMASAQTSLIFDDTVSTCTGTNCSSLLIPGTVLGQAASSTDGAAYWEAGLFATAGQCLRVDVISEDADLEMVVRAPNGAVFRNDDKSFFDFRPRVVISGTPSNGWYSTTLAHFAGSGVDANFTLLYGRYPSGNPNCSPATTALNPAEPEPAKPDDGGAPVAPEPAEP